MTMHVDRSVVIRPPGATFFGRLMSFASAELRAWRAQRIERANFEALQALAPELLDDIGVKIVTTGRPVKSMATCHSHVIAATLFAAQPTKRGES